MMCRNKGKTVYRKLQFHFIIKHISTENFIQKYLSRNLFSIGNLKKKLNLKTVK